MWTLVQEVSSALALIGANSSELQGSKFLLFL